jgi:hypothetical protein
VLLVGPRPRRTRHGPVRPSFLVMRGDLGRGYRKRSDIGDVCVQGREGGTARRLQQKFETVRRFPILLPLLVNTSRQA